MKIQAPKLKTMLSTLRYLLQVTRPVTSFLATVLSITTIFANMDHSLIWSALRSIPMFLVAMAGFVFNDIFDRDKDRLARTNKPLAQGAIQVSTASLFGIALMASAVVWEASFLWLRSAIALVVTLAAVILYTPVAHRVPTIKGLYTALLCCAPIWYGECVAGFNARPEAFLALIVFIFGRELLLDIRDMNVDRAFGLVTLPHFVSQRASAIVGWGCMLLGSGVLPLLSDSAVGFSLGVATILVVLICLAVYLGNRGFSLTMSRVGLFTGAISISLMAP